MHEQLIYNEHENQARVQNSIDQAISHYVHTEAPPILTKIRDDAERSLEHCLGLSCTFQQQLQERL